MGIPQLHRINIDDLELIILKITGRAISVGRYAYHRDHRSLQMMLKLCHSFRDLGLRPGHIAELLRHIIQAQCQRLIFFSHRKVLRLQPFNISFTVHLFTQEIPPLIFLHS